MRPFLERIKGGYRAVSTDGLYLPVILYIVVWSLSFALIGGLIAGIEAWPGYSLYLLVYCVLDWPTNLIGFVWLLVFGILTCYKQQGPNRWIISAVVLGGAQALFLTGLVLGLHTPDIRILGGNDIYIDEGSMDGYLSPSLLDVLGQYGCPCFVASLAASYVLARLD